MPRKRRYTDEEFIEAVKTSYSVRQTLIKLGLKGTGGNYYHFHTLVKRLNVCTKHFTGKGHLKGKTHSWAPTRPLEEILVENSTYTNRYKLKQRLLKANVLKYNCVECGITEWNNQPIALHLDHINGISDDHRLENLRLLCPNCHSQTDTYAGKSKGRRK